MGKVELNIEIDPDSAEEAARLGVDLARAGRAGVELALARQRNSLKTAEERARDARAWAEENAEALKAYNERVARDGIFGEDFRTW
ncbi:MAG: type II toxin-antitoxin system CcdA family antitoxin [Brevundimonas sp.]|uniref:type II toxin-antitoxin system CcdA family antitoxin n=1 Tax=Brevundimonas sp. TaxID=1871086 RepID=UPI001802C335|nr:type II toxin-antitoxin system CcdA family antitoxin [Brevundimonas sp.]MBA4804063.1 type II toxin-antitoxin system CcdA family antitoxin [Brevundimonas sp.]